MKQNVCIYMDRAMLDLIDSTRGDVPRSRMVASLIGKGIESKNAKETGAGRQAQTPATAPVKEGD